MFTATFQFTRRAYGPGTRSDFDAGMADYVGPFDSIEEALAAAIAARDERAAQGYDVCWIMVDDEDSREVVLDVTAGQVEAVKLGMQDVAGLLAFRAEQEARWAAQAAETRAMLAAIATDDLPF